MLHQYMSIGYTNIGDLPSRVTNSEATGFDTTNGSGTNDQNSLLFSLDQDFSGLTLWDTLGNQCDGTDTLELETLQRAAVHTP